MTTPSIADGSTGFFDANDSARARIMQLTTMSGINSPSVRSSSGRNACIKSCTAVTKPEIITIYEAMRICCGMIFRSSEMKTFEQASTAVTASPMPTAFAIDVVTARVEHIPSICASTGFLSSSPSASCRLKSLML